MKILIVGSKKVWSIENHFTQYFIEMGHEVVHFGAQNRYFEQYYKSTLHKIAHRLGLMNTLQNINQEILSVIAENKFDVVWVFKGMEIFPETLRKIKKLGIKLVNYNPDHPFNYSFKGSGNKNIKLSVPIYDLHFTYSLKIKEKIEKEYDVPCLWLPFGYNKVDSTIPLESEEIVKVCFIGTSDTYRVSIIKWLETNHIKVDIYGNGWAKNKEIIRSKDIKVYPPVYGNKYIETALNYRIQLNLFRPQNDSSHNMRSFEMPGMGSIMVAPDSVEHQLLFKDGLEAFFFSDKETLIKKINDIIMMPYQEAINIRQNAIRRSTKEGYTYKDRADFVLSTFNELLISSR